MESLRDLFVKLGLDWEPAGFASAEAAVHLLEEGLHLCVEAVEKLADVFIDSVKETAEYGENMEVLAQKTGIGVESIQKLGYAAQLSHSSAEDLQTGLAHLSREIEKAKDGGEEAQKAFHKIGISMEDVRKKSPEDIFFQLADQVKKTGNVSTRTAAVFDILGKGGLSLVPTLMRGSAGLKEMGEEAEDLNVVMGEDAVHSAAVFKENIEKLHAVVEGLTHMIGGPLIEALQPLDDEIILWIRANKELIRQRITGFVETLGKGLKLVGQGFHLVIDSVGKFVGAIKIAAVAYGAFIIAQTIVNVGLGQTLVNLALDSIAWIAYAATVVWAGLTTAAAWLAAVAPVVLLTAALTIAALAAEDFYVFLKGGDSVIGNLGPKWTKFVDEFFAPHPEDNWLMAFFRDIGDQIFNFERRFDAVWKKLEKFWEFLKYGKEGIAGHKFGAWETDPEQEQRDKTKAAVLAMEERGRTKSQGVMAAGGNDYGGAAPWRAQGSFAPGMMWPSSLPAPAGNKVELQAPVTVIVPPGTPQSLVKDALKEAVSDHWNGVMRDAGAATAGPG